MRNVDTVIIGAGPTGLGAALAFEDQQADWLLVEAGDQPGGLAASFVDDAGFTWDLGGHVQFSHYESFDHLMDRALGTDGWLQHERESWVWMRNRWIPYPFQNNLHRLDPDDKWTVIQGLLEANQRNAQDNSNFGAWIDSTFGSGLSEIFMRPYNWKVWATPPELMDADWIGERVSVPSLEQALKGICTGEDSVSWGPNATFRFPKQGGTGAVWKAVASMLPQNKICYNSAVNAVDAENKRLTLSTGESLGYTTLLSTMPLNKLAACTAGVDGVDNATKLVYSATHVVGVGLNGTPPPALKGKCWMYFPEESSPYYRVTVFSHYSPNNVPRPGTQWSLMTETSESTHKPVDAETLISDTLRALEEDGLIQKDAEILSTVHRRLPQGYPTPFLGRNGVVDPLLRSFEARDIYSRGRFGAWKYEVSNQDHSYAQGKECAERILSNGGPEMEPTMHRPSYVNSQRNA